MPSVRLVNVSKNYGEIKAVENINLQIEDKDYICIIGPSGCGKTTLIKCISGIIEPSKGEVYIESRLVNNVPIQDREIGYVFQEIALFPHMNVYENVSYGPTVKGWDPLVTRNLVEEMLNMMTITERVNDHPSVLSGGAQQKTAIARALASGSLLLLMDEPLGSLDAKVRAMLRYELRKMVKDLKLTVVHVTHDQEEAMAVADKIVVMKAGEIIEAGTPRDLYLRPKKLFTANFVGEANFMIGEIVDDIGNYVKIKVNDTFLYSSKKVEERKIVAVIRPEFVLVGKGSNIKESWHGIIENKIFIGSTVRYEVRTQNGDLILVKRPFVSTEYRWNIGDSVDLSFPPSSILLYPYPKAGLEKEISME